MTNRQLAAQATKRKLMAAAKQLVCEKGLAGTSVEEITKACGVSSGTFYTYFKRKEDIAQAIGWEMYRELYEKAQAYDGPLMARLVYFMTTFSEYIEKSSLKLCQEWVRNNVDPDLVEESKLAMDLASLRGLLASGVERGELRGDTPVEVLAHTLVDLLYGQMLCWDMSGGDYSFAGRTREFCDTFLPGLMAPYLHGKEG